MMMTKDNDFACGENQFVTFASMAVIGDRNTQEDCFGCHTGEECILLCVCDGMGGYAGGANASKTAVHTILETFAAQPAAQNPTESLKELTVKANQEVLALRHSIENARNAGSTLVLVFIQKDLLYWSAVGDSRLYIWRKQEFVQMTKDQNYHTVLNEKRNAGTITQEEFEQGRARGDALVHYLGIDRLDLIDYNKEPFRLRSGDRLILCTDGLYRMLSDTEIAGILNMNQDAKSTLQLIEFAVRKKSGAVNARRDNMTVSLIEVK